jgi:phospholipid/cholesterol/gamma-HCH transport system substrate-binding protein
METRFGREVVVGALVLVAAAIFVFGTMWLSGRSVRKRGEVVIQFSDAGDLKRATPVRVSGVPVGKVNDIRLVEPGKVHVSISLPPGITPRTDALAYVRSVGLAGDAALVFVPGSEPTPLPKGQVVMGIQPPGLMEVAGKLGGSADTLLGNLRTLTGPDRAVQIDRTLRRLDETLASTQRLMAFYANPEKGPSAELEATLREFRLLAARLDSTLTAPAVVRARDKADTLVGNLSEMSAQFRATGERLDSVLAKLERGEGTLGRVATDTALYHEAVKVTSSIDSLVNDLRRNPGKIGVTVKLF